MELLHCLCRDVAIHAVTFGMQMMRIYPNVVVIHLVPQHTQRVGFVHPAFLLRANARALEKYSSILRGKLLLLIGLYTGRISIIYIVVQLEESSL